MNNQEAMRLFSDYLRVTGVAHTGSEPEGDPALIGKRLGLLNGSSWITLWANYFGRLFLPGVHLVNVGNEAVQINFMQAHARGEPTPPQSNIDLFARYAVDLVDLAQVSAVLITCSTMNRSYPTVQKALEPYGVPAIQIDRPMMVRAVSYAGAANRGGKILVVATHGPTIASTQALLRETAHDLERNFANDMPRAVSFAGANVEEAWHRLALGDVQGHNQALAQAIRSGLDQDKMDCVVLAQLSMSVFLLSHPDPVAEFGVPVFTSGQCGFEHVRQVLSRQA